MIELIATTDKKKTDRLDFVVSSLADGSTRMCGEVLHEHTRLSSAYYLVVVIVK